MFELNKWYKFVGSRSEFFDESMYNEKIYNIIEGHVFKVLEFLPDTKNVSKILVNGRELIASDISSGLDIVFSKNEAWFFEEVKKTSDDKDEDDCIVLVQILDGVKSFPLITAKHKVDECVEDFLSNNPKGKVEIYVLSKVASMGVVYN